MPSTYEPEFQKHFQTHYASTDARYEDLAPAYEFGFQMASDPKYQGKKFHDVEAQIKKDYLHRYPDSDWDAIWDALFFGWEKAGGDAGGFGFI